MISNTNSLTMGATSFSDLLQAEPYSGLLDEVRLSKVARYTGKITPDISGHNHDGEVLGGAQIDSAGRIGGCIALDGNKQKVEIPDHADFNFGSSNFTLEAWINPSSSSFSSFSSFARNSFIISKWSEGQKSYRLVLVDGKLTLELSTDGIATTAILTSATDIVSDTWTKIAATRDGNTITLLINDAVTATATFDGTLFDSAAPVILGEGFAGKLDNVRILPAASSVIIPITTTTTYEYNARNQLVTETTGAIVKTYSYDNNGNNIQIVDNADPVKTITMTYDCLNRLLSWSDGTNTESNAYRGAEWHRTSQTANGATTSFLYDGANVVADIGTSIKNYELRINELPKMEDVSIKFYVTPFLDQNLSMTTSGQTYYYLQDGLGSVRSLTTSSGATINRYAYTAFGEPHVAGTSETIPQRYGYTGREKNPLSNTNSNRYRTLHPTLGRFSSRDPIGYRGGINLYEYISGRTTLFTDPLGLKWEHEGSSIWKATADGDTLAQLATIVSHNDKDWSCIWPISDWKNPAGYPTAKACDKADVSNLTSSDGPTLHINMMTLFNVRSKFLGYMDLRSGTAVAEMVNFMSKEGAEPIIDFELVGHGGNAPGGKDPDPDESKDFTPASLAAISNPPTYARAVQKKGPYRCWFSRFAQARFTGCDSAPA